MERQVNRSLVLLAVALTLLATAASPAEEQTSCRVVVKQGEEGVTLVREMAEKLPLYRRFRRTEGAFRVDTRFTRGVGKIEHSSTLIFANGTDWIYIAAADGLPLLIAEPRRALVYNFKEQEYVMLVPKEGHTICAAFCITGSGISSDFIETRADTAIVWVNLRNDFVWCKPSTQVVWMGTDEKYMLVMQDSEAEDLSAPKPPIAKRAPLRTSFWVDLTRRWPVGRVTTENPADVNAMSTSISFSETAAPAGGLRPLMDEAGLQAMGLPILPVATVEDLLRLLRQPPLGVDIKEMDEKALAAAKKSLAERSPWARWVMLTLGRDAGAGAPAGTPMKSGNKYEEMIDEAVALAKKKQYGQAEGQLRALAIEYPKRAEAHVALGKVLHRKRDLDEAIVELRKAINIDPKNDVAYEELVAVYCKKNEFVKAKEVISAAEAQDLWSAINPATVRAVEESAGNTGSLFEPRHW
jgi:hypothetical protein